MLTLLYFYIGPNCFNSDVVISVPDTSEWAEMLTHYPATIVQPPSYSPVLSRDLLSDPSAYGSGVRRKRRQGISHVQRVQRPMVSLDDEVAAFNALSIEQQEEVEAQAARGITGPNVIHR